ncbi:hypothetical protein IC229_33730 [Spirosoma sp. BT702]|uniref:Uncharacterized protein n=1 Tax=Spirosoma profusum TaxID=2771354 RepID=A0A927AW87_9BACT|nr:hypothetical protein [Spirosoma profusum]MBD2705618.1 hypothetical protein [Spirosoma profusum]
MPDYNEIFYADFKEMQPPGVHIPSAQYRISIKMADYAGEATEIFAYAEDNGCCQIGLADGSGSLFLPMLSQICDIDLRFTSHEQAEQLYVTGDRFIRVDVLSDQLGGFNYTKTEFSGWILPRNLTYDYKKPPFRLKATAVCGLASLKDRPLLNPDGTRLKGHVSYAQIIRTCLYWTGLSTTLTTSVNLYELSDVATGQLVDGKANPAKDPLYQSLLRGERYISDKGEVTNCYDVLQEILLEKECSLEQLEGGWFLSRIPERGGKWDVSNLTGDSIHYRKYTSSSLSAAPGSHGSLSLIQTTSLSGSLRVKRGTPKEGLQAIKNGVRIEQKFGGYTSKIPNADFSQVTNGIPTGWGTNMGSGDRSVIGDGTVDNPYRIKMMGYGDELWNGGTPYVGVHIDYPEGAQERTKHLKRTFKCRARLSGLRAAKIVAKVYRKEDDHALTQLVSYLRIDNDWKFEKNLKSTESKGNLFYNYTTIGGVQQSKPGWFPISLDLGTLDRVWALEIFFCPGEALDKSTGGPFTGPPPPYVEYADPKLEVEYDGFTLDGIQQTIVNPGQTVKDPTLTLTLGDVPAGNRPDDRYNTEYVRGIGSTPISSSIWYRPDADILDPTPAQKDIGKTQLSWITEEYARQLMNPARSFEGELSGRLDYGPLTVLRIFDTGSHNLILTRWQWDLRTCKHTISARELLPATVSVPTPLKEWQSPDGAFPLNEREDGEIEQPTEPEEKDPSQALLDILQKFGATERPTLVAYVPGFVFDPRPAGVRPTLTVLGNQGQVLKNISGLFRKEFLPPNPFGS